MWLFPFNVIDVIDDSDNCGFSRYLFGLKRERSFAAPAYINGFTGAGAYGIDGDNSRPTGEAADQRGYEYADRDRHEHHAERRPVPRRVTEVARQLLDAVT